MALLMLAGVAIGFVPYYAASRDMQHFCATLVVDTPVAQIRSQAAARGYDVIPVDAAHVLMKVPPLAPQVPSKRGCELRVGPTGQLVSATYSESL